MKILITLFKHPQFSPHILIFEQHDSFLLRDHNVNTTFYKHVLCHPANSKSDFFLTRKTLSIFTRPWIYILTSPISNFFICFYFSYPIVNYLTYPNWSFVACLVSLLGLIIIIIYVYGWDSLRSILAQSLLLARGGRRLLLGVFLSKIPCTKNCDIPARISAIFFICYCWFFTVLAIAR